MNPVKIPINLKSKSIDWYFTNLYDNDSYINLDNNIYDTIDTIDNYNKIIVIYIIYQIITNSNLEPINMETPSGGFNFRNKNGKSFTDQLGIYHAHLENEMVLIWYLEKRLDNELYLIIDYIKHPESYKKILIGIFNTKYGFNIITNKYFNDYKSKTYLKENKYVKMFKFFLIKK